jgi:hypothetical protein
MINWKEHADALIEEYNLCCRARPKHNAVDIQILKDSVGKWANHLMTQRAWGSDVEIAEACHQLEPRLRDLKDQVVIEILKNGSI